MMMRHNARCRAIDYQTYNAKQKYRTSRKITAYLEGKRYAGEHEECHCPYDKNVADLRFPIKQCSWTIKTTIVRIGTNIAAITHAVIE